LPRAFRPLLDRSALRAFADRPHARCARVLLEARAALASLRVLGLWPCLLSISEPRAAGARSAVYKRAAKPHAVSERVGGVAAAQRSTSERSERSA